ncbi:Alpha/beta hydrolase family protein [Sodalis glossinidius str. 'morsitans']|uniref:Alpha/beta hydrolase family protein n=1 Tax=Sodalis glossinidius (strain morsitans) TaxID=343509 RepID=A0A193QL08_SODGM|nr:alpha/beta fold hydrolase [Sodalis glossinidius]CRL45610.1 Alpha/beta hydrolase family protein [Sodalis glossinidius str. 'morsitans']
MDDMTDKMTLSAAYTLREMGSFYLGAPPHTVAGADVSDYVLAPGGVPVSIDPNGTTSVGQAWGQYFLPAAATHSLPLSFWHGGSLTGAMWETTPDGREGWLHYFLRHGCPVYNVDAVERGRAGWAPRDPHFSSPAILRTAEDSFCQFSIGSRVQRATPDALQAAAYPHCQFSLAAFEHFMCQVMPRWATTDDLILAAYCWLLDRIDPQIIIAHSQGTAFALRAAALRPDRVKAIVDIEPAQGGGEEALAALTDIPLLLVYGDNLHYDARWPQIRARTDAYFAQLSARGVRVDVLDLPQASLLGNFHMLMMELNNHAIAALIARWLMDIPGASRPDDGNDDDGKCEQA